MEHGLGSHRWKSNSHRIQHNGPDQNCAEQKESWPRIHGRICTVNAVAGNEHVLMCASSTLGKITKPSKIQWYHIKYNTVI